MLYGDCIHFLFFIIITVTSIAHSWLKLKSKIIHFDINSDRKMQKYRKVYNRPSHNETITSVKQLYLKNKPQVSNRVPNTQPPHLTLGSGNFNSVKSTPTADKIVKTKTRHKHPVAISAPPISPSMADMAV